MSILQETTIKTVYIILYFVFVLLTYSVFYNCIHYNLTENHEQVHRIIFENHNASYIFMRASPSEGYTEAYFNLETDRRDMMMLQHNINEIVEYNMVSVLQAVVLVFSAVFSGFILLIVMKGA